MANISKIRLDNNDYDIKDSQARGDIVSINEQIALIGDTMDFIQGLNMKYVRYNGIGGYTNTYYAIISADHKPVLKLANDQLDNEDYVANMAHANKSTLSINAGVYNTTTHNTAGSVVVDGEFLQLNYDTFASDRELLIMNKAGRLDVLPYTATESQIMATDPEWAIQGFYTLVYNFNNTSFVSDNTDFRERTLIGQDSDGNYIVVVSEGRSDVNVGFNPLDCVNFCTSVSFTPRILYSLDGGGSSQIVYHGITMNQLAGDTGETRKVPNAIHWISPKAHTRGVFDTALTANNAIIARRRENIPYNIKPLITASSGVTITNLSVSKQGSYVYLEGQFVTSASTSAYGTLATGFPKPTANAYFQAFNTVTKTVYYVYIGSSNGNFNNSNLEALPAGTYYIRSFYRTTPAKALADGNE